MTKSFKAEFSNGKVKILKKSVKDYTHAFCICWNGKDGVERTNIGFASSKELAAKAIGREHPSRYDAKKNKWLKDESIQLTFSEIVEVQAGA